MMPTLGTLALITSAHLVGPSRIEVGILIAFETTYSLFVAGVIATAGATSAVLQTGPGGRALGLASEARHRGLGRAGRLRGGIRLVEVTFATAPEPARARRPIAGH